MAIPGLCPLGESGKEKKKLSVFAHRSIKTGKVAYAHRVTAPIEQRRKALAKE